MPTVGVTCSVTCTRSGRSGWCALQQYDDVSRSHDTAQRSMSIACHTQINSAARYQAEAVGPARSKEQDVGLISTTATCHPLSLSHTHTIGSLTPCLFHSLSLHVHTVAAMPLKEMIPPNTHLTQNNTQWQQSLNNHHTAAVAVVPAVVALAVLLGAVSSCEMSHSLTATSRSYDRGVEGMGLHARCGCGRRLIHVDTPY